MKDFLLRQVARAEIALDKAKRRLEHIQFLMGLFFLPPLSLLAAVNWTAHASSRPWWALLPLVVAAILCIRYLDFICGRQGVDGNANKWSWALAAKFPRWRWAIGAVLNAGAVYLLPALAYFYLFALLMYIVAHFFAPGFDGT